MLLYTVSPKWRSFLSISAHSEVCQQAPQIDTPTNVTPIQMKPERSMLRLPSTSLARPRQETSYSFTSLPVRISLKPIKSPETLSRDSRAPSESMMLTWRNTTDYVFPGRPGEAPYEARAPPDPTNLYGQTKLDGERAILQATEETGLGIILRVPVLYGQAENPAESAVNILMDIVWKSQEKESRTKMDDWAKRYPTNIEDVARVCVDTATMYLDDERHRLPRILQFSSEDSFTKYEICQMFAEIMGLPLEGMVADKAGNDPNASVQRPYDTHLSNRALKDIGINVRTQDFKAWW